MHLQPLEYGILLYYYYTIIIILLLLLLLLSSTYRGIGPSDRWPAKEDGSYVKCSSSKENVTSNS